MGKIDYEELKRTAYDVKNGNTENSQINTVDLTGNAGKIIIGENSSDKTYSHPDDPNKSYNIKNVYLSKNKIFENAPETYSHELVIQMNSTDSTDDDKMFIIFFVDPDVLNLSENNKKSDKEFRFLNNNDVDNKTLADIDLSNLINENYQNAFFMNISGINNTPYSKVILFEEPIKTDLSGTVLTINKFFKDSDASKFAFNYKNLKYYAGGTYYTECDIQDGGEDSEDSASPPSPPDIEPPSIDWDKYLPYILAVACGILMILIVVTLGAGGKKFGDKFSNIITEAINKLSQKNKEGAGTTEEISNN